MADKSKTYNLLFKSNGKEDLVRQDQILVLINQGIGCGELIKRSEKGRASSLLIKTRINKYRMNKKLNGPFLVSRTGDVG